MKLRSLKTRKYILVTPAKDEEANLPFLAKSVVNQSLKPSLWVIVNDNSSDRTGEIAEELAKKHDWIEVLHLKGSGNYDLKYRYSQVVRIGFEKALSLAIEQRIPFGYIGVLDADFILERKFFEKLIEAFRKEPSLGIVSGGIYYLRNGRLVWEGTNPERPEGSPRLFRRECFREVGGYREGPSPDVVSYYLAKFLGWKTRQVVDAIAVQLRETEGRFGYLWGYEMVGWSNYKLGTSFTSIIARAGFLILQNPVKSYALIAGYLKAFKNREKRIENGDLRKMILKDLTLRSNFHKLKKIIETKKLVPVRESYVRG